MLGEAGGDGGIAHGDLMVRFAEAVIVGDDRQLGTARDDLVRTLGEAAMVDAAAVVATFNAIDRVADATGTPIEEEKVAQTEDLRAQLGINAFPSVMAG